MSEMKVKYLDMDEIKPHVDDLMTQIANIIPAENDNNVPVDIWFKRTFTMLMGAVIASKAKGMELDFVIHNVTVMYNAISMAEFVPVPEKKDVN